MAELGETANVVFQDLQLQKESQECKDYLDYLAIKEDEVIKARKGLKESVAKME